MREVGSSTLLSPTIYLTNMTPANSKTLIIIPAYNAAKYFDRLVPRLRQSLPDADFIIIDDGSTDNSRELLDKMNVPAITNETNRGKGYSIKRGIQYARERGYDYIITLDADLQHLPEELTGFLQAGRSADIYMGTRPFEFRRMPPHRWLSNNLTSIIVSYFCKTRIRDSQSGYRMIKTDLTDHIKIKSNRFDFESEMLFKAGLAGAKIAEIPISLVYDGGGSHVHPVRDTLRFVKLIWKRIWM